MRLVKRLMISLFMLGSFLFANSESEILIITTGSITKRRNTQVNRTYSKNKVEFKMNNIDDRSLIYIKELGEGKTEGSVLCSHGKQQLISFSSNKLKDNLEGELKFSTNMKGFLTLRTVYN